MALVDRDPLMRAVWTDPVTGRNGFLVVHSVVSGLTTGGTRMRAGITLGEVEDLARGMALKAAVFDLPVGGAKGGIDCDPKDGRARGVLARFLTAMRPWIEAHWVTAEDLGVPQQLIDEVFTELGLDQSYHAAIRRAGDPQATLARVQAGLASPVPGGYRLGDVVGGYGVAQACLGVVHARGWAGPDTTVAVQGVGTMGGAAAWYLHQAGLTVTTLADAAGALHHPHGLDVPALLDARDRYGEIDRRRAGPGVARLDRDAALTTEVDLLVPAAVSYALTADNADRVRARAVVEAANAATTPEAELTLAGRGIPVIPDFVANAGAVAWAWWLLLGHVDADPVLTFTTLRREMLTKIGPLLAAWDDDRITPRVTGWQLADRHTAQHTAAAAADHPAALP